MLTDDINFPSQARPRLYLVIRDLGGFLAYTLALFLILLLHREVAWETWH